MSSCPGAVSDTLLLAIGACCPALRTLYLEYDEAYEDEAQAEMDGDAAGGAGTGGMARGSYSDAGLAALARGCSHLQVYR